MEEPKWNVILATFFLLPVLGGAESWVDTQSLCFLDCLGCPSSPQTTLQNSSNFSTFYHGLLSCRSWCRQSGTAAGQPSGQGNIQESRARQASRVHRIRC